MRTVPMGRWDANSNLLVPVSMCRVRHLSSPVQLAAVLTLKRPFEQLSQQSEQLSEQAVVTGDVEWLVWSACMV